VQPEATTTAPLVASLLHHTHYQLADSPQLVAAAAVTAVHKGSPVVKRIHLTTRKLFKRVRGRMDGGALLLQAGILGSGLLSGLYFIFSFCVMNALNAQSPSSAIATMNSINEVIINPPFILVFMGTPIVCAVLLYSCFKEGLGKTIDNQFTAAGALVLLVGEFLLTAVVHVPKNDALAAYAVGSGSDVSTWANYYTTWTPWNHVRMLASMVTVTLLSTALHLRALRLVPPIDMQ
jgi:uncharacterized membrane protein